MSTSPYTQPPYQEPPYQQPPGRKRPIGCYIALGVAAGVGLLVLIVLIALWGAISAAFAGPQNINLTVNGPQRVATGETFSIEVLIENTADRPQTLDSIDLFDSYLDGIHITASEPPYRQSSHVFLFTTYDYQLEIPPHETLTVVLTAEALREGDFRGDLDACINNEYTCVTQLLRTVVGPAPASPAAPPDAPPTAPTDTDQNRQAPGQNFRGQAP